MGSESRGGINMSESFESFVMAGGPVEESPGPTFAYEPDGKTISVLLSIENHYGQWIGDGITVYRSQEDSRIIGIHIEGLASMIRDDKHVVRRLDRGRDSGSGQ
jgi:hypothetical protein